MAVFKDNDTLTSAPPHLYFQACRFVATDAAKPFLEDNCLTVTL